MAYTYSKISSVTVGSGGSPSIAFIAIPQNYTDLLVKLSTRDSRTDNQYGVLNVAFNGSPTYSGRIIYSVGSTAGSTTAAGSWLYSNGNISTSNTFSNAEIYIPNYTDGDYKSISADVAVEHNGASDNTLVLTAGSATLTGAITSITFTPNSGSLMQYSTATLYGIKAEV